MQAVLGMSCEEFEILVPGIEKCYREELEQRPDREREVGAGAKGKLPDARAKLFFILFYMKVYPTFDLIGLFFDLNRSECCRWMHRLRPILEEVLRRKLVLPKRKISTVEEFYQAFPNAREVLVDGTERPIQRPTKASTNRKHYSGKKKRHTRKAIVVVDENRRIGVITPSKRGVRHDKRFAESHRIIESIPPEICVIADSGFQGARHHQLCLPIKGTKKRPLSQEDRDSNRLLSSIRVLVEHAIGGMKRFASAASIYRNHKKYCDDSFNLLAAGLWNFRLANKAS